MFCAAYRFADIKSIGFASRITVYSNFFITKQIISYVLAILYLTLIVLVFTLPDKDADICWFIFYQKQPSCLAYLIVISAWIVSERLMSYEYRKRLSEAFYSHKLFWSLNLVTDIIGICVNYDSQGSLIKSFSVLEFIANLFLCVMMLMTKKRTRYNPRPDQ